MVQDKMKRRVSKSLLMPPTWASLSGIPPMCTDMDTAKVSPSLNQLTLELIGKWFKKTGRRNEIFLATKFGHTLDGHRTGKVAVRGDKEYVKEACDESLKRLGIDQIDLYYLHRYILCLKF
jgi:aryl-alcohol dehydrogenase-like predicted oxidoreductase